LEGDKSFELLPDTMFLSMSFEGVCAF